MYFRGTSPKQEPLSKGLTLATKHILHIEKNIYKYHFVPKSFRQVLSRQISSTAKDGSEHLS